MSSISRRKGKRDQTLGKRPPGSDKLSVEHEGRLLSRRRWLKKTAVGAGGALATMTFQPKDASGTECVSAFGFEEPFPLWAMEGGCETACRIDGAVKVPDFELDVVNTFAIPVGGVSNVTVNLISGGGSSIDLGGTPSGDISFQDDVASPGSGTMDFNLNHYHCINPVIITLANYPGLQYSTSIDFNGSIKCTMTYDPESGTDLYELAMEGSGTGVLPPEFPHYGGGSIDLQTVDATGVPAFGPLGLLTVAVGLGGLALMRLKSGRGYVEDESENAE